MFRVSLKAVSSLKITLNLLPVDDSPVAGRVSVTGGDVVFGGIVSVGDKVTLSAAVVSSKGSGTSVMLTVEGEAVLCSPVGPLSLAGNVERIKGGAIVFVVPFVELVVWAEITPKEERK